MIRVGYFADLVLFDPKIVIDRATPEAPHVPAEGIEKVWVNGQLVFDGGQMTGNRPGQPVRRTAFSSPRTAVAGR
jgi:N-acyl-D-amino-acid deacylase